MKIAKFFEEFNPNQRTWPMIVLERRPGQTTLIEERFRMKAKECRANAKLWEEEWAAYFD